MSLRHDFLYPAACLAVLAGAGVVNAAPCEARAGELRMTVEQPHFTCEGSGTMLSHIAFHPRRQAHAVPVLPCCDGKLGCAQFLSTSTILHPMRQWHG